MCDSLKIGTLIVAEGVSLPMSDAKTKSFCAGWRTIENIEARGMDRRFSDMGWSCFEKACPATVNVVGIGDPATLIKAFQKLVQRNKTVKFNCLEITEAVHKTFIGVSFVHLSARARSIKQRLW
ncbi:MAG: hypothetical protein ACM3SW_14055 [Actinomycetota bacterium]